MIRKSTLLPLALALPVLGLAGSWALSHRQAQQGTDWEVPVAGYDPRDLLRGDYVILRYEISSIPVRLVLNRPDGSFTSREGDIFVRIKKDADGYWRAVSASLDEPSTPPGSDEIDIKGHVGAGWSLGDGASLSPDYGIERFYVPEGEGRAIEQDMRVRPFGVKVAVAKDGTAQVKALMDGDKTLFEEPLY